MSVLVFVDHKNGKITKAGLEAIGYARQMGGSPTVVSYGNLEGDGGAGAYGASKVIVATAIANFDAQRITRLLTQLAADLSINTIVMSHDHSGKMIAPRLAARMDAAMVAGAVSLPETAVGFVVKKNVFSGKAIAQVSLKSDKKIISVLPNSIGLSPVDGTATVETTSIDGGTSALTVKEFKPTSTDGAVPLPEASHVVSAGRGMKGPENWGPVEELATLLGATTACSRPVADIGWRPHHEHVGQTGVAIRPDLYIAIGISGAIQHLAGVNGSKVIVVINTDPEAPFFKSADYGIIGDAFTVLPKLIEATKQFNASK
jgi:electron transfer flavoprotein alpha subunit